MLWKTKSLQQNSGIKSDMALRVLPFGTEKILTAQAWRKKRIVIDEISWFNLKDHQG